MIGGRQPQMLDAVAQRRVGLAPAQDFVDLNDLVEFVVSYGVCSDA
jgi:hypothetical protein